MTEFIAIAAVAENGVIGSGDELPWHYPADLRRFRQITMGNTVLMGRVTWESTPDLDGRDTIVVSKSLDSTDMPDRCYVASSKEEAIRMGSRLSERVYVAGGESIYRQFLEECSHLVLTRIPEAPNGDAFFPQDEIDNWQKIYQLPGPSGMIWSVLRREAQ